MWPGEFEEDSRSMGTVKYPRPLSVPPSPMSSRGGTPPASEIDSDEDDIDSEGEVSKP